MISEPRALSVPAAVPRDLQAERDLEIRLHVHQAFTDVLYDLMRACDDPPGDAALMDLLERSVESVVEITDSELGAFMLRDARDESLVLVLHHGSAPAPAPRWQPVAGNGGIAHWVARNNRHAVVNNVENDPRCDHEPSWGAAMPVRSALAVPVVSGNEVLGVVEVLNKRHGALYALRDRKRLELICNFDGKLLADMVGRFQDAEASAREPARGSPKHR